MRIAKELAFTPMFSTTIWALPPGVTEGVELGSDGPDALAQPQV
jgi:hypothetical protein